MKTLKATQMMVELGEEDFVDIKRNLVKLGEDVYRTHFPIKEMQTNKTVISYIYPERVPDGIEWVKYSPR